MAEKVGNVFQNFGTKPALRFSGLRPGSIPPSFGAASETHSAAAPGNRRLQTRAYRSSSWLSPDVGHDFSPHHAGATPFPSSKNVTSTPRGDVYKVTHSPGDCLLKGKVSRRGGACGCGSPTRRRPAPAGPRRGRRSGSCPRRPWRAGPRSCGGCGCNCSCRHW